MVKLLFALFALLVLSHTTTAIEKLCRLTEPCPVSYKTLGCYKDFGNSRKLPNYIYNERDSSASNYGNRKIDWYNWEHYMAGFSCRCAKKAQQLGYDLFGVQFYGECWAGKSNLHLSSLTKEDAKCIGDSFKPCGTNDRYCAGEQLSNFVYQIVNTTCNIEFVKQGCFADNHNDNARPLGNYLLNDRDSTTSVYSGQEIDWKNWDVYLPDFICRCANAAKKNASKFFGMQYYGECWGHPQGDNTYGIDGHQDNCVNRCYHDCDGEPFCSGVQLSNYVYRIKEEEGCDVDIQPIGCYIEDQDDLVFNDLLINAKYPPGEKFYGEMADDENWNGFFPEFLCKCAHEAKLKGQLYFGVSNFGDCYSDNISENYGRLGISNNCYEGKKSQACSAGSTLCAGADLYANYVYKVVSS